MKFGSRLVPRFRGALSVFLCAPLFILSVAAAHADSLYEAAVPVAAASADELKRAAAIGLAEVLVGASGRAEVVEQPAVRAALASADRYVEQYRYEQQPPDNALVIKLTFAQATIEALLRTSAPAAAGNTRQTLVLMVTGVETFSDYSQLVAYLGRILGVRAVALQSVSGNIVTMQLRLDGAVDQFTRQLALDRRLAPESAPIDTTAAVNTTGGLRFRWQGG